MNDMFLQQRITFPGPLDRIRVVAKASGLLVVCETNGVNYFLHLLKNNSISYELDEFHIIKISLKYFRKLVELENVVDFVYDEDLGTLHRILTNEPVHGSLATVVKDFDSYVVTWVSEENRKFIENVSANGVRVLSVAGIPFNAPKDTWGILTKDLHLPVKAAISYLKDNFIALEPYSENFLQSLNIPGLFKTQDGVYGVSIFAKNFIENCEEIIVRDNLEFSSDADIFQLKKANSHEYNNLNMLLKLHKSRIIVNEDTEEDNDLILLSQLVESLNHYPCLVVTAPHRIPAWMYLLQYKYNLKASLTISYEKVRVVSYEYLSTSNNISTPSSVIFDLPENYLTRKDSYKLFSKFKGSLDTVKISSVKKLPSEIDSLNRLASVTIPQEFDANFNINLRYPTKPEENFQDHVDYYVSRFKAPPAALNVFPTPTTVELGDYLNEKINDLACRRFDSKDLFVNTLEIINGGDNSVMSPKIGASLEIIQNNIDNFSKIYVYSSSLLFIKSFVKLSAAIFSKNDKIKSINIDYDSLPEVEENSLVVSTDYFDLETLANFTKNKSYIKIIHALDTLDEKLAVMSVLKDRKSFVKQDYSFEELEWILN